MWRRAVPKAVLASGALALVLLASRRHQGRPPTPPGAQGPGRTQRAAGQRSLAPPAFIVAPQSPGLYPSPRPPPAASSPDSGLRFPSSSEGVREAIRSALPDMWQCYQEWRMLQPSLAGRLQISFTVERDQGEGRVGKLSAGDGGMGNVAFRGCVLSVVSGLRFGPPPDGGYAASVPLRFFAPPVPSERLRPALTELCSRMGEEASRPELAKVAPDRRLTAVLGKLGADAPGLEDYLDELLPADVPPFQRKALFKLGMGSAVGGRWECPAFESLWDGEPR